MMRICILSRYPPDRGGIATHTYNLTNGLSDRGHEIVIITYQRLGRRSEKENVRIYEVPVIDKFFLRGLSYFLGCFITLIRIRDQIDLIHIHPIQLVGLIGILFKKLWNVPFVITSHGSDLLKWSNFPLIGRIFSGIANSSEKLICVSHFLARRAVEIGIEKDKIEVIPNGVSVPDPLRRTDKEKLRRELKLQGKVVLFVGSLTKVKRPDLLLDCAKEIDASFFFIGEGPLKTKLERSGLKNIRLLGEQDHETTLKYIKSSDLVVVPSEYEGFGLVAVEASLLRTPVIARPVAGLTEVLSPESLSNDLKEKMIDVLKNKQMRNLIIKKNEEMAKKFTLGRMVDQIERIYKKLIKPESY